MNWTLEVVHVPVSDVDRAKGFYAERLGFAVDLDTDLGSQRLVQLTPVGSGCSIHIGMGLYDMAPGSLDGVVLVVADLRAAHTELSGRGVAVGELEVRDRTGGRRPARIGDNLDNVGFFSFADPDGNRWTVQQISSRATRSA